MNGSVLYLHTSISTQTSVSVCQYTLGLNYNVLLKSKYDLIHFRLHLATHMRLLWPDYKNDLIHLGFPGYTQISVHTYPA